MQDKIKTYGQFFTPDSISEIMLSLIVNKGRTLEPSSGDGVFFNKIPDCIGIEIDEKFCLPDCLKMDFFDYNVIEKFSTIIGNPPYVKYNAISGDTKDKIVTNIFDDRTNLYQYFIEKCFCMLEDHGEIIFITPREFLKATSNLEMNKLLFENGTFTHYYDMGDDNVFPGAQPNCCIWRYEKNNFNRESKTNDGVKTCSIINGQIVFCSKEYNVDFSDIFDVRVGGVSGADVIFTHEDGNMDFVCSYTKSTGKTKRMIYNTC
ncbi:MAG: class I SAM-dependent methyltransferase, partial [Clostridiales bacterium]|nr:class I SAM-dependent methyltransferase [Clostridiales bacterium]